MITVHQPERFRRVLESLLVAMVFVIPFSIAAIEILFPLLLVGWLISEMGEVTASKRTPLRVNEKAVLWALGLYAGICTLSVFTSEFFLLSLTGLVGKTLEYTLLFLIAFRAIQQPSMPERCLQALLLAAWLVVLHSLLQQGAIARAVYKSTVRDPILGRTLEYVRMQGPYKNPNDLATYLMVVGSIALSDILHRSRIVWNRYALVALMIGSLVWTQSRAALLGFFCGAPIFLAIFWKDRRRRWGILLLLAAAVLFFCYLARLTLREALTLTDIGSRDRATMWKTAWAMIQANPLWGHGINTFMANYTKYVGDSSRWPAYAHNCYLQIVAETGVVGLVPFVAFLLFLGSCIYETLKIRKDPLLAGLAAGLLAFLVQSTFDTNFYALRQAALFWTLAGIAFGLCDQILRNGPQSI